jgi:hypothetical protein
MANKLLGDWEVVRSWLPKGWREEAHRSRAFERSRKIKTPEALLKLLLFRVCGGSLRKTAMQAGAGASQKVTDVAILKRQRAANAWLRWLIAGLLIGSKIKLKVPAWLGRYRVRVVDGTVVTEPTRAHGKWRVHYSYDLFSMRCDCLLVTGGDIGETLKHFPVAPGDLIMGDRLYASLSGMWYVKQQGGDFIVRARNKAFKYYPAANSGEIKLLPWLRGLKPHQVKEWTLRIQAFDYDPLLVRVCVFRLADREAAKAQRRAEEEAKREGRQMDPETRELQRYVVVVTSVPQAELSTNQILQLYRARWQIEITFKRLKTLMRVGKLPCRTEASSSSWLLGKMLTALLVQRLIDEGRYCSLREMGLLGSEAGDAEVDWEGNIWREVEFSYGLLKAIVERSDSLLELLRKWFFLIGALAERPRRRRRQTRVLFGCLS